MCLNNNSVIEWLTNGTGQNYSYNSTPEEMEEETDGDGEVAEAVLAINR